MAIQATMAYSVSRLRQSFSDGYSGYSGLQRDSSEANVFIRLFMLYNGLQRDWNIEDVFRLDRPSFIQLAFNGRPIEHVSCPS